MSEERRWVVWWWPHGHGIADGDIPVPLERRFLTFSEAADCIAMLAHPKTDWAKLFKSGDEADVRARWNRIEGWSDLSPAASAAVLVGGDDPARFRPMTTGGLPDEAFWPDGVGGDEP